MKIRSGHLSPPLAGHLSKFRSLLPKLAALFELADMADAEGSLSSPTTISLDHARQSAALCEYLEGHAVRMYSCVVSPEVRAAQELARRIQSGEVPAEFTTRSLYVKGWSDLDSPERVRATLDLLEEAGWVRRVEPEKNKRGGRPAGKWQVNPKVRREKE